MLEEAVQVFAGSEGLMLSLYTRSCRPVGLKELGWIVGAFDGACGAACGGVGVTCVGGAGAWLHPANADAHENSMRPRIRNAIPRLREATCRTVAEK